MSYIYIALALLALALFILWLSSRRQKEAGLPGGRVIYTDTRAWGAPLEKPLYDSKLGLTGKPDYLVEQKGQIIPVEVKSGRAPDSPYDLHIYQLASYCLLVDKIYGKRPALRDHPLPLALLCRGLHPRARILPARPAGGDAPRRSPRGSGLFP